jgi:acyl-CoA thioester hydrolase
VSDIDLSRFPHRYEARVRFSEVDLFGALNNARYASYFEDGRLRYMREAGVADLTRLFDADPYYIVRNELNYRRIVRYDEAIAIYTRVARLGRTSFRFEHAATRLPEEEIVADGVGVAVRVDPESERPKPLDETFIRNIQAYDTAAERDAKEERR